MQRVSLVQGASRGLGLAMVKAILAREPEGLVIATSRDPQASEGLRAVAAEAGRRLALVPLDLEEEASIARAAEGVGAWTERLHRLVNVSGVLHDDRGLGPERRLSEVKQENLQRAFAVNAFGPILVAKHFAALLTHDARAVLANLSARVGSIGDNRLGGWYTYRASKAAQNQLTKTLALELRRRAKNVTVLALHPGTVDTALSKPFQRNVKPEKLFSAAYSAERLLDVMDGASPKDSGGFFDYDGRPIEW